jgi:hypothetical protein
MTKVPISWQLGHATVQITLDTYSHLISEDHGHAVNDCDALITSGCWATIRAAGPSVLVDAGQGIREGP